MARFCKNCGTPLNDDATFCGKCGTPVGGAPAGRGPIYTSTNADKFKLGVFIASALVIISTILPYASVSLFGFSESVSLLKGGDGWFFIAAAAVAIVGAVIGKPILPLVGGVIAALLSLFEIANTKSELGAYSSMVDMGLGFYLNLIASIALAAVGVLLFLDAKKTQ